MAFLLKWCGWRDSNPHAEAPDPKSGVSTNFTTPAHFKGRKGSEFFSQVKRLRTFVKRTHFRSPLRLPFAPCKSCGFVRLFWQWQRKPTPCRVPRGMVDSCKAKRGFLPHPCTPSQAKPGPRLGAGYVAPTRVPLDWGLRRTPEAWRAGWGCTFHHEWGEGWTAGLGWLQSNGGGLNGRVLWRSMDRAQWVTYPSTQPGKMMAWVQGEFLNGWHLGVRGLWSPTQEEAFRLEWQISRER